MTQSEWNDSINPRVMLEFARKRMNPRTIRLLAAACCRVVFNQLPISSQHAVETAEKFADKRINDRRRSEVWQRINHCLLNKCNHAYSDTDCYLFLKCGWYVTNRSAIIAAEGAMKILRMLPSAEAASRVRMAKKPSSYLIMKSSRQCAERIQMRDALHADLLRDIIDPFWIWPKTSWISSNVYAIAKGIYDDRAYGNLSILADAIEESGCSDSYIINHCRESRTHVRGCHVLDLILRNGITRSFAG
jgi:hypothetical protein